MFQDGFNAAQLQSIVAGNGASTAPISTRGFASYYIQNRSGATVYLYDDQGHVIDICPAFFIISGNFDNSVAYCILKVNAGDSVVLSGNYATQYWNVKAQFSAISMPVQQTPIDLGSLIASVSGSVGVTGVGGNVSVINVKEYLGVLPLITGPKATLTNVGQYPIKAEYNALYLGTGGASCSRLVVAGATTGLTYFDGPTQALVNVIVPLLSASDTAVNVSLITDYAFSFFVNATAIKHPVLANPQNFGNPPLIVQPASGVSQTVVPGTGAANASVAASGRITFSEGGIDSVVRSRPNTIHAIVWNVTINPATTTNGNYATGYLGLKGTTTGNVVFLQGFGIDAVSGQNYAAMGDTTIFPYPLSGPLLLPNDSQVTYTMYYSGTVLPFIGMELINS